MFSIASVSASDLNNTDQVIGVSSQDDSLSVSVEDVNNTNALSVSNDDVLSAGLGSGNDNVLGADAAGSYSDLVHLIKLASDNLVLYQDYEYKGSGDVNTLEIDKILTIDGNGHTINGNNQARGFTVSAENVTIKNFNLINLRAADNAASVYWLGDNGQLLNTNISGGHVTKPGFAYTGGVSWWGNDGKIVALDLQNCTWPGEQGTGYRTGSAFSCCGDSLKVINSTFHDINDKGVNTPGGLISILGSSRDTNFYGCNFTECYAYSSHDGAIFCEASYGYFEKCRFVNKVNQGNGFAYTTDPIHFKDCYFEAHKSMPMFQRIEECRFDYCNFTIGNALVTKYTSVDNEFTYCNFANMTNVFNSVSSQGAGIDSILYCNFTDCGNVFSSNYHANGYVTIDNCIFNRITTTYSSGAIIHLSGAGVRNTITNCVFKNCTSTNDIAVVSSSTKSLLENNVKADGSAAAIIDRGGRYVKNDFFIVEEGATGDGSGGSPVNINYALTNIARDGLIVVRSGNYDLNKGRFSVDFNIRPEKDVILGNCSFIIKPGYCLENLTIVSASNVFTMSYNTHIKNVTFINTSLTYLIQMGTNSEVTNCSIIDSTVNCVTNDNGFAYNTFLVKDMNLSNVTVASSVTNENMGFNYVTFENIYFTNCNISKFFANRNNGVVVQCTSNNNFLNINFIGCNITNDLFSKTIPNNKINFDKLVFDTINIIDCNLTDGSAIFVTTRNSEFNNIYISNLNNSVAVNIFNFSNTGHRVNNITIDSANPLNYLINSLAYYELNGLSCSNVNVSSLVNTLYEDMNINGLYLTDVNFTSGIILTLSNDMVLSDSNFTDFTGHVVVAGNNIVIRDTNFTGGNNSDLNGGAVYVESGDFLTIENCRFISNNASYGGAVYSNANPTAIMNSVFEDNRALANNGTTSCGGAIYIGDVYNSIDDFTKSYLLNELNYNDLRLVNPNNTLFTVIYVVPKWQEYKNNESLSGDGSGKDINNPTNISDARIKAGPYCEIYFINNPDWSSNYYNMTNTTINPDNVVEFVVRYSGMVFYGNNSIIDNLYFTVDGANATFKDLTFTNNTGHSALVINQEDSVVDNCTFLNNGGEAVSAGAAIQVLANNTSILNSTFTSNVVGNIGGANGGAVFINASDIVISSCDFSDNQAYTTGSHLFVVDDNELRDISLIDCNFTSGQVIGSGLGSGVYLSGDNLVVYNSNFTDNIGRQGAGLTVTGSTINLNITGNNFTDNRAIPQTIGDSGNFVGGAVFFDSSRGPISIVDNIFTGNNASIDGGALYINNMPSSGNILAGNVFSDNHALGGNGGAVYVNKVDYPLTVSGGEFTDNNATGNGGAIYINASVNINDASFNGNNATRDGGAIYNNNTLSLNSNTFNGNGAVNGGAVFNDGVLVDKGSRYIGNVATRDGGAIYSKSDLDYSTTRSIASFSGNRAVNGGAVYVNGTNNNIRGALFTDNSADFGSCIYAEDGSDLNVYDVEITGNHVTNGPQASGGHGDIYLGEIVNFAIPTDSLKLDLARPDGSSDYTQYIYNNTMVRSDVLYVSESGTGLGLMSSEPTTLDKALQAINDNGRIVFVESYMLNTTTINRNVTLAGYNSIISMKRNNSTAGENKYLFILLNNKIIKLKIIHLIHHIKNV